MFGAFKATVTVTGSQHSIVLCPTSSLGSYTPCPLFGPFWAMLCPLTAYLLVTAPEASMIAAGVINVGEPAVPPLTMSGSIESPRGFGLLAIREIPG